MTTTPETWTRYPRSTDPAKDVAALSARLVSTKLRLRWLSDEILNGRIWFAPVVAHELASLCTILDLEHQDWIAQRGVEAVRKAVMPEDAL